MRKITASDALDLSIPDRIVLVEDIWDSIVAEVETLEVTDEEKKLIDERLQAYHKNPNSVKPWKEIYERISRKRGI